jgi:hypothetical protein
VILEGMLSFLALLACQNPGNRVALPKAFPLDELPPVLGDDPIGPSDDSGTANDSGTKDDSGIATDDSATSDDSGTPAAWLVPDFALVDLNTASPRYGEVVSPRDYVGHASGWYFIHST